MKYFIEVTLLPSVEIPLYFLWEKVYQQIHLALVEIKKEDGSVTVGVSFPAYDARRNELGSKLRLFSQTFTELEELAISQWLSRLKDYVHITGIRDIPNKTKGYAVFKRVQTKSSKMRLARRKAKREGIDLDAAIKVLSFYQEKTSNLPYIRLKSLSSGKWYRLMVSSSKVEKIQNVGTFSTYGLGACRSVPLF